VIIISNKSINDNNKNNNYKFKEKEKRYTAKPESLEFFI